MTEQKNGRGSEELDQLKHLSTKINEVTPNVVTTEKNEKLCHTKGVSGTQRAFSDKVTPDIDDFTDESVVQRDAQVAEST